MNSKFIFLLTLGLHLSILGIAQRTDLHFNYKGNDFSPKINAWVAKNSRLSVYTANYLSQNFFHLYDSLCNQGAGLIKFRFDKSGKLVDLSCSKTFPLLLNQALKTAIIASEKYWVVPDRSKNSQWIVLPVVYDYHTICDEIKHDSYDENGGMFVFEDSSIIKDLDCLMLDPMLISTGVLDRDLIPQPKQKE